MFEKGEYLVYGTHGICRVEEVTYPLMKTADRERLYYVLQPIYANGNKIYVPVDSLRSNLRRVITKEECGALLDLIPRLEALLVDNEKQREQVYKTAMLSNDCREWVKVIKTIYLRKHQRMSQGKKMTLVDERYLRMAQDNLYGEMSFALGEDKEDMESYIKNHVEQMAAV